MPLSEHSWYTFSMNAYAQIPGHEAFRSDDESKYIKLEKVGLWCVIFIIIMSTCNTKFFQTPTGDLTITLH